MKVRVLNCGSSTLKFAFFDTEATTEAVVIDGVLANGIADRIGSGGILRVPLANESESSLPAEFTSHDDAIRALFDWLTSSGLTSPDGLAAIGHRVVHGGQRFCAPTILNREVIHGSTDGACTAP